MSTAIVKDSTPKYVLLRGLTHNNRFFTSNHPNPELLADGTVGYVVIGYANSVREAQLNLYGRSTTELEE